MNTLKKQTKHSILTSSYSNNKVPLFQKYRDESNDKDF